MIERIGKKSGVLIDRTPKYLHARSESYLAYVAFAGRVHGGLFPVFHTSSTETIGRTIGRLPEPTFMPPKKTGCNLPKSVSNQNHAKRARTRPQRHGTPMPCDCASDIAPHNKSTARLDIPQISTLLARWEQTPGDDLTAVAPEKTRIIPQSTKASILPDMILDIGCVF